MIDKTKEAFEIIEQGVKDVFLSDNFRNYLKCVSKFHHYSFNNTMLILSQKPDATLVSGFSSWSKNFNRHVLKGQQGIKILAPYQKTVTGYKTKTDEDGVIETDEYGNSIKEIVKQKITAYRVVNVFDVSQTDGDPMPTLISDLKGSSVEAVSFIDALIQVSAVPVTFVDAEKDFTLMTGAKGYYVPAENRIVVRNDMDDIQKAKTLAHEYAHSQLHKSTDKDSFQKEVEAESLAFVICDHFGIDTSDYSFGYVASYSSEEPGKIKSILSGIQSDAHIIIEQIEPVFIEKLNERQNTDIAKLNISEESFTEKDKEVTR